MMPLELLRSVDAIWGQTPWQVQFLLLTIFVFDYMKMVKRFMQSLSPDKEENTERLQDLPEADEPMEDPEDHLDPDPEDLLDPKEWVEDQMRAICAAYGLESPSDRKKTGT